MVRHMYRVYALVRRVIAAGVCVRLLCTISYSNVTAERKIAHSCNRRLDTKKIGREEREREIDR